MSGTGISGHAVPRFEAVADAFARVVGGQGGPSVRGGTGGSYAGASTAGRYALGFVTALMGSHSRVDAVENAFRACLGLPPLEE